MILLCNFDALVKLSEVVPEPVEEVEEKPEEEEEKKEGEEGGEEDAEAGREDTEVTRFKLAKCPIFTKSFVYNGVDSLL